MAVIEILHPRHGSKIESDEVNAHILVKNYEMGLDAGCAAIFLNTHYRYKSCAAEIKVTLSSIRPGMSVIDISLLDSNDRELNHAPWYNSSRSYGKDILHWNKNARPYKLLVSYGTEAFQDSLKTLAATAISIGGVDGVKMFGPQHLNQDFTSANSRIFNQRKGAGLWLWKPYLINQSLHTLSEGDLLMYADAQLTFVSSATPLFDIAEAEELGIVSFGMAQHKEYVYTKEEVLFALNCTEECRFSGQRAATFIVFRVCESSKEFVRQWLTLSQNYSLISDEENGAQQHEEVLCKHWGVPAYRVPTQYGENALEKNSMHGKYPQIFQAK
ncbi:hypothetical protein GUITHDRAFT_140982 [Guillardia theta CCMP2712]|uniref:Uncharacterized protein n=1 Tax=Guillardia theta (strain CCMP2712) TaxID=905079 RepID=L1J2V2_GUITC|nr:hypothetical protein GUITHDRAFT_140982 [Guillardia theta CCMP2712]EKX42848.1 hypothetical protein GUITHDRAFT_140982 [Guillardia theta CCMP2712]|eukprot:XP_005829828.1 hypothetical protein GUITHDRAFT_140982 [Guillardia theta CCMP2712]